MINVGSVAVVGDVDRPVKCTAVTRVASAMKAATT